MMLTDLADAARASGLRVVEIAGWRTRGRPASTGGFDPAGVLCHHAGSSADGLPYAQWLATKGRPDLPPPLAHLSLDREGTVYVLAAGRANHAGVAKASGPMPAGGGNTLYVGIEAQNTGSEGWSVVQNAAYVRLCAALCRHYGWPASHVRAHKETSVTGKWDPGRLDMDKHRAAVALLIEQETDMATPEEVAAEVIHGEKLANGGYLGWNIVAARTELAAITKALAAIADALGPTVKAAVEAALADAVVNVDVNVNQGGASAAGSGS